MTICVGSHFILAVFLYGESCIQNKTTWFVDSGTDVILGCFCSNQSHSTFKGPLIPSSNGEDDSSPYTDGFKLNPELNIDKFMIVSSNNNECNLKIMNFSREQDGLYRCEYFIMETVYTRVYNVVITNTPYMNLYITPKPSLNFEGHNGMICCIVETNPPGVFTKWIKDTEILQTLIGSKNCFAFSPFHRNHSGQYTCFAENNSSRSKSSIELTILYPPNVTVSYTLGTTFIDFTCNAAGEPNSYTFLQWKHESEYKEHIRFFNGTTDGKLRVHRTHNFGNQYADSGYYICRVQNSIPDITGKKTQEGKVFVIFEALKRPLQSKNEFKPIYPVIAVIIIGLVVAGFVLRRYTNNCTSRQSSSDINGSDEDLQGSAVTNQLYQSSHPVQLIDVRGQAESRLMEDASDSHMSSNNRSLGPDLELSAGMDSTGQNRSVSLEGAIAQISESNLNYVDVMFEARPGTRQFVIHGEEARTIYSDIDHLSRAVALPSSSESESDDDHVYIGGIKHLSGKRKA